MEKKIDWDKAARYEVPCFFWTGKRPEKPDVDRLGSYFPGESLKYHSLCGDCFEHCEIILDTDRKICALEEPEDRAVENWEEFKVFMGQYAVNKEGNDWRIISHLTHSVTGGETKASPLWWFKDWELVEPIKGSRVIGVKV